jgi:hypothetical protein
VKLALHMQEAPYILGLGSDGAHNTFRPLILQICNSTFLPNTDADLAAEEVALGNHSDSLEMKCSAFAGRGCLTSEPPK